MPLSARQRDEFFELLELLRERRITKPQLQQLESIALGSPAAMDAYVRYMAVAAGLRQRLQGMRQLPEIVERSVSAHTAATPHSSIWRRQRRWAAVAAALATSLAVAIALLSTGNNKHAPETIGSLDAIQGEVFISREGKPDRPASVGAQILSGDSLRTRSLQGLAGLFRPDGTRLMLIGDSLISFDPVNANRAKLHHGLVAAQVQTRPGDQPIEFVTAEGTARVLGTKLALEATPNHTELTVTEGHVRFTRSKDGRSIDVRQGKRVVEGANADLVVSQITGAADDWIVDFEAGLPTGWKLGRAVNDALPAGSKVAVAAAGDPQQSGLSYGIVTNHDWAGGLFTVRDPSCLNITYKFEKPGWVQVFMGTRDADLASATNAHVYLLEPWEAAESERWWNVPAGKWHTASIPLAKFFNIANRDAQPEAGEVCFGFTFSSQDHDRGLVVDKIWVTSDGPPSVEFKGSP